MVAGVSVGVDAGLGMRGPWYQGPVSDSWFYSAELDAALGITGMATGGGLSVLVVWTSHTSPFAKMSLDPPRPRSARRST